MIAEDEDDGVEIVRAFGQRRVERALHRRDVRHREPREARGERRAREAIEHEGRVLRDHAAARADDAREQLGGVAAAREQIRDVPAGLDAEEREHLRRMTTCVERAIVVGALGRRDDRRDARVDDRCRGWRCRRRVCGSGRSRYRVRGGRRDAAACRIRRQHLRQPPAVSLRPPLHRLTASRSLRIACLYRTRMSCRRAGGSGSSTNSCLRSPLASEPI